MDFGWADLLAALLGAIVGIVVAWLGLKGRKEEASVTFNGDLLQRQGDRIARLETQLDDVEAALRATQVLLRVEEDRTHQLRRALEDAIGWLRDFVDWVRSDRKTAPPEPDIADLAAVVRASYQSPTARNPPQASEADEA